MLNKEVTSALNEQLNREFYSAYMYLGISAWYEERNLSGFANWFRVQAQEERDHAMLIFDYLIKNNEVIDLKSIHNVDEVFAQLDQPLKAALKHEYFITSSINDIYELAQQQKDYRTSVFLEFFIREQVEEESNAEGLVNQFAFLEDDLHAVYLLDQKLAQRTYVPITTNTTAPNQP